MEYKSNNNVVYSCKYHVVWCPKYRRKVLVNGVDVRLKAIIEKVRLQVARLHEHVCNQRQDMLHKLSIQLVRENDVICLEDLAPKNMVRNHRLAKSISDVSWGEFRRQLAYKAEWYGKKVVAVDRFYPSSQLCSVCGAQWPGAKDLAVREWMCPVCGVKHDRDANAARNILNEGLRLLA